MLCSALAEAPAAACSNRNRPGCPGGREYFRLWFQGAFPGKKQQPEETFGERSIWTTYLHFFPKNPGLMWHDILVSWAPDRSRQIGTKTYGPPYKDPGLPTDEFCACGKRLWALTEHNVDWHVNGRQGGGGCAALEWRRWQEASVIEAEVERWRTKARETAEGLVGGSSGAAGVLGW